MTSHTTRRRLTTTLLAGLLSATLVLTGCSGGSGGEEPASSSSADAPVTIDTAYGEITVDEKPERIIALTGRHAELLNTLDEEPIAWADYLMTPEEVLDTYPWLEGTYSIDPDPSLFTADYLPAAEAIAALEPDLILTTVWQTDEASYEQLSQIAPTYVGTVEGGNTSWQDDLTSLAQLTRHDTAIVDEVQADYDARFAEAAEELPGLQGMTFQIAALGDGDQLWLTEYGANPVMALGLVPGEGQPTRADQALDAPRYSLENVDQLTADVLIMPTEHRDPSGEFREAIEADPRVAQLPAAVNDTLIYPTPTEWLAINGGSASSELWWLDRVLPTLRDSNLNQGE